MRDFSRIAKILIISVLVVVGVFAFINFKNSNEYVVKVTKVIDKEAIFTTEGKVINIMTHQEHGVVYRISLGSVRVPSEMTLKGLSTPKK